MQPSVEHLNRTVKVRARRASVSKERALEEKAIVQAREVREIGPASAVIAARRDMGPNNAGRKTGTKRQASPRG